MDEAPYLPINPHPGFGPGPVNATCRLPRRGSSSPEEYIEISSSPPSPSSPPSSDTSDREEAVREHQNPLLQELQGPPFPSPRQFSSPPSLELGAIRGTEAAARDLDNFAPQFNRAIHIAQQNLMGDEMSLSQNYDNFDALDIQDPELARLMEEEFNAQMGLRQPENDVLSVSSQQAAGQSQPTTESKDTCLNMVLIVFPDICPRHVTNLYDTISKHGERVIAHILENMDGGMPYPKAKDTKKPLKRKRELDEDEEATLKYDSPGRPTNIGNYHRRDM
jgi:hypothetical protein